MPRRTRTPAPTDTPSSAAGDAPTPRQLTEIQALSRRAFIRVATAGAAAAGALGLAACKGDDSPAADAGASDAGPPVDAAPADATPADTAARPFDLPSLGGAPDTAQGRTIAAFCDTVMPGKHRDPAGKPGAIDVGSVAAFFDPELPAASYVSLLAALLDGKSRQVAKVPFVRATPAQRDDVLDRLLAEVALVDFAIQLAKLSFFASPGGAAYLGYPGANPGYGSDTDFSFGVALTTEITKDGNLA